VSLFPLPFTCLWESYTPGEEDGHGNTTPGWADPETVPCAWWPVSSEEPAGPPTGSERVVAELALVINVTVAVDHRDRFTVNADGTGGKRYEVTGLPKNFNYGLFGFSPNRQVVELRMVR